MSDVLYSGLSGGVAGICVDLIYFPLDTIKTRIQASSSQINYTKATTSKFNGLASQISFSFPAAFIFFFTYDRVKVFLRDTIFIDIKWYKRHLVAASCGEVVANTLRNPFEVIKSQQQVGLSSTIKSTIEHIWVAQGWKGFYAGYGSILMREIPFSAIQFPIYESMKRRAIQEKNHLTWTDSIINGGTAGGIAAFLTTPCDVLKSKLMTQRGQFYSSIFDCAGQVYRSEGLIGFFRACHIRSLQISTSGILFFGIYEQVLGVLRQNYQ